MTNTDVLSLRDLQQQIRLQLLYPLERKVFVGFDGFIDKIKKAVKERQNTRTEYFETIRDFTDRLLMACGKSGQVQMDTQRIKIGGNAPILAQELGQLGVKSYCLGAMGYPQQHELFSIMTPLCEVISVLDPGISDAIEFSDGKLIFSELEVFDGYTWSYIKDHAGLDRIVKAVTDSSLIAFVDWANLPHASDIWQGVLDDVIKPLKRKDFLFLFDLSDPSKKTTQQIDEVLDIMSCFSSYGRVTVGLNENETLRIWAALRGMDFVKDRAKLPPVLEAGKDVYQSMKVDTLLVHPADRSIVYHQDQVIELSGHYVANPTVLTGGGDNLNAGYCFGLLGGLPLEQCMLLGMAASGAYVEHGVNAGLATILEYLDRWIHEMEQLQVLPGQPMFAHRHE
ncbi:hypothetical protein [Parachryseolinea silvisoli]|uniref:hypothetical protein n=1 Tax=Parachryseolinea silvisoli TaxID=2873601 RepID=UPI002265DD89|nr:hypothetical protein [Parachryseolinea silvisoli]MCD9015138.1 hypothetical protein [Parachryseolinea silvisoli]